MSKKGKRCPHCKQIMVAFKRYRTNYPHGIESRPLKVLKHVKFVCMNDKCPYFKHSRKKYSEYTTDGNEFYTTMEIEESNVMKI